MAVGCRWPLGWQTLPALLLRDALIPALWIGAFTGRSFTWKGTAMQMDDRRSRKNVDAAVLRPEDGV